MGYRGAVAAVVGAGMFWSFMGLVVRHIEAAGPIAIVFWRSAGMLPVILLFLLLRGRGGWFAGIRGTGWAGLVAACGITSAYIGAIYALQATTVANAVFLYSAAPFLAALLGWLFLGERVGRWTLLAMGIAGLGIFVMIGGFGGEGLGGGSLRGNLAALGSALGFAVFTVALRHGGVGDMMPANALGAIVSMLAALVLAPAFGQSLAASAHDIVLSLALGAVVLAGGMILFTLGSRHLPAAQATLFASVENILAPIWVWLFLNEGASLRTLIGGGLVLGAVLLNAFFGARAGAPASNPAREG